MKEKMKEKKTEIMMWTDAESKFAQEKAKLSGVGREAGLNMRKLTKIRQELSNRKLS